MLAVGMQLIVVGKLFSKEIIAEMKMSRYESEIRKWGAADADRIST